MNIRLLSLLAVATSVVLSLSGCTSDSDDGDTSGGGGTNPPIVLSERNLRSQANSDGVVTFTFELPAGTSAFQLLTFPGNNQIQLLTLSGPQGNIELSALSALDRPATRFQSQLNVLNMPFTPTNLAAGAYSARYLVVELAGETPAAGAEVTAKLLSKSDSNLDSGSVGVNMILTGPLSGSSDLREDLEDALSRAASILSSAGLSLNVEWFDVMGPDILPDPRSGDIFYANLANEVRPNAVNIVFGSQVTGLSDPDFRYTVTTFDGSPAVPTAFSVGAISILTVAGSDGKFNFDGDDADQVHEDEIRLASEEIAQLIAHYLGLAHIVQNAGGITTAADALTDTPSCVTIAECRDEETVRENLMFPYPLEVLNSNEDTYGRTQLTSQQKQILQRSVLVN